MRNPWHAAQYWSKIYEDLELQYPLYRLRGAGHTVDVIGPKQGETYVGDQPTV